VFRENNPEWVRGNSVDSAVAVIRKKKEKIREIRGK